jgi:hypothetical protein
MKAWSAALANEVSGWPQVEGRSFFGFTALYRNDYMFAALPRTRAMETPNSFVFKIENPTPSLRARLEVDRRVGLMSMRNVRWFTFELSSDADLHDALDWLGQACEAVKRAGTRNRKRP